MGLLDAATDRSARRWLYRMDDELGIGWAALRSQPGLSAEFEQHLTDVADTIRQTEGSTERAVPTSQLVLLASHAYTTRECALRGGWRAPSTETEWTSEEWVGLRLLACYALASRERRGPKPRLAVS